MALVPLYDKIIVERVEAAAVSKGGIVLPDSAQEKPKQGKVIAVGKGKVTDSGARGEMVLKKGDEVLFTSYAGTEVQDGDNDYLIMSESDVLAVLSK
ncbi:MAG: co-chaperone GroES [Planctomycetota bacterium]|nr:MAG: co-chaperone GroES [Planctomycetota bacterium]